MGIRLGFCQGFTGPQQELGLVLGLPKNNLDLVSI